MRLKRRDFLQLSTVSAATVLVAGLQSCKSDTEKTAGTYASDSLQPMTKDVVPISAKERQERVAKAQHLLAEQKMQALVLDAGTSLLYFTGISWGQSERPMVAVIPAKGEVFYICPGFEESRLRERITIGKDVYAWQEDESPYALIASAFKKAGIESGTIGMEERLRFFIFDGIRKQTPHLSYASGDSVTMPCRLIKSPAEIALMQKASDITVAAIQAGISSLREGMSQQEVASIVSEAQTKLGGVSDFALILFGESSAMPHGSIKPKTLKKGDIVLMDCGCSVESYTSDITRTIVFGAQPTKRQLDIWTLEQKAQAAGFAAAKNGMACELVDAAARKVITDAGFGPGYQLPGLPHRTGHGIGADVHEWGNMVKGNKQLFEPGMCFSIEPTISIPGEFGVRLEDCAYMTADGPKWFSKTAVSINQPFG
ncbi:M24 family metallopeptidase [Sediminibacterium soli]|uniref:M24 family metallopeptidase n=1 Tax=Sediminibacterium soli TaxID=2698829 RepID=UPI00137A56C5|nr:Xaa-Pro peptidase family protein [Sediminibacterium soli]NCI48200.1 aminopeptidase P family protein [Sediminibacterium soli]